MIINIFKISTMEMWTISNKKELAKLIENEINVYVSDRLTVSQLVKYFPVENYCVIKNRKEKSI